MIALIALLSGAALASPGAPAEPDAAPADAVPADAEGPELPADPAELRAMIRKDLAEEGTPAEVLDALVERIASDIELQRSLQPQTGEIHLGDDLAILHLSEAYGFLSSADAVKVLVAWGNPAPSEPPLGLVYPMEGGLFGPGSWAVFVEYSDEGHVDDADATSIDYDELLAELQEGQREANEARTAAGYDPLEVVGWAEPPRYDAGAKKLYWAKHLRSPDGETLNYDIRVLGRRGVLSMSAVSALEDLEAVKTGMEALLPQVEFVQGERYADFDPSVDKVAAVGIAALIGGKLAAKAGLFKIVLAALLAGKKFVLAGLVGAAALVKTMFGRKKAD